MWRRGRIGTMTPTTNNPWGSHRHRHHSHHSHRGRGHFGPPLPFTFNLVRRGCGGGFGTIAGGLLQSGWRSSRICKTSWSASQPRLFYLALFLPSSRRLSLSNDIPSTVDDYFLSGDLIFSIYFQYIIPYKPTQLGDFVPKLVPRGNEMSAHIIL